MTERDKLGRSAEQNPVVLFYFSWYLGERSVNAFELPIGCFISVRFGFRFELV